MFILGLILDFFQRFFLAPNSGMLLRAIGVVLVPALLIIEEQMAQYLGGIVQHVLLVFLICWLPIMRLPARGAGRRNRVIRATDVSLDVDSWTLAPAHGVVRRTGEALRPEAGSAGE